MNYQIVRYKLKENCDLLTHKCGNFDSSNTSKLKKASKKKEQRTRSCLSHFITISVFGLIRILLVANIALIDVENISKYGEKKRLFVNSIKCISSLPYIFNLYERQLICRFYKQLPFRYC